MITRSSTIPTPLGPLAIVVDESDRVVASGFASPERLLGDSRDLPPPTRASAPPEAVRALVEAYLAGDLDALARVRLRIPGDGFRRAAWEALHAVPAGRTVSYAELAELAGSPAASRAAGTACARNRLAPFVPCHRVIRSDGSLGRYGYGLGAKRWLLDHEAPGGPATSG